MIVYASQPSDSPVITQLASSVRQPLVVVGARLFAGQEPRAEKRLAEFREPNSRGADLLSEGKTKTGADVQGLGNGLAGPVDAVAA